MTLRKKMQVFAVPWLPSLREGRRPFVGVVNGRVDIWTMRELGEAHNLAKNVILREREAEL